MFSHERAAQEAIRAVYGRPVAYTGAGLSGSLVTGIKCDARGQPFEGFEGKTASLSFEIDKSELPERPDKGNLIEEGGGERWEVTDVGDRPDIEAWVLTVEEAE